MILCYYSQKLCYFRRSAVPAGRQGSPGRLAKIFKTSVHGLSAAAENLWTIFFHCLQQRRRYELTRRDQVCDISA
jgi:hypothetical protein